jgi:predicted nucleotidyltransferase
MSKKYIDISGKIEDIVLDAIATIKTVAEEKGVSFFLVGAMARDFILEHWHKIPTSRATLDIDFGIRVPGWNEFLRLKQGLIDTGDFQKERAINRLFYSDRLRIDLIPFGPIEENGRKIFWPPNQDIVMSVLGFEDSFNNSLTVQLRKDPMLEIKIATLAGLAIMKLISWDDRYPERAKDASDLKTIIYSYTDAGNSERIFDELIEFVDSDQFDYVAAGAIILGRDMSRIMSDESRKAIFVILEKETNEQGNYRLIEDMIRSGALPSSDYDYAIKLLHYMKQGLIDVI